MPHSFGYRARTRAMFSRDFRKRGVIALGTYLRTYKVGDYVDLKTNSAVQKGMPHKFYHGRTGVVFNVTKRALGVEVNKVVRNKQLKKRIHVRVEHVRPSKCRDGHLKRVAENEAHKKAVREGKAEYKPLKRVPKGPRAGYTVKVTESNKPLLLRPLPYEIMA